LLMSWVVKHYPCHMIPCILTMMTSHLFIPFLTGSPIQRLPPPSIRIKDIKVLENAKEFFFTNFSPCSSSLAFRFLVVKVFVVFRRYVSIAISLFLLICLLFASIAYHVHCLTYCVLLFSGSIIFVSRSVVGI